MTPGWLSFACLLHGQPPLDATRPLTFMELGCGNGLTSCLVAATYPGVSVWGYDFNPAHVERARHYASAAGLANCVFEEASFEELASSPEAGPRQVDVIALHGVYTLDHGREPAPRGRDRPPTPRPWRARCTSAIQCRAGGRASCRSSRRCGGTWPPTAAAPTSPSVGRGDGAAACRRRRPLVPTRAVRAVVPRRDRRPRPRLRRPRVPRRLVPSDDVLRGRRRAGRRQVHVRRRGRPGQRDRRPDRAARPPRAGHARLRTWCCARRWRTSASTGCSAPTSSAAGWRRCAARSTVGSSMPCRWSGREREYEAEREVALTGGSVHLDESYYRPLVERLTRGALTGADIREVVRGRGLPDSEVGGTLALLVASGYALPALPGAERAVEPASADEPRPRRAGACRQPPRVPRRAGHRHDDRHRPRRDADRRCVLGRRRARGAEPDRDGRPDRFGNSVSCPP